MYRVKAIVPLTKEERLVFLLVSNYIAIDLFSFYFYLNMNISYLGHKHHKSPYKSLGLPGII